MTTLVKNNGGGESKEEENECFLLTGGDVGHRMWILNRIFRFLSSKELYNFLNVTSTKLRTYKVHFESLFDEENSNSILDEPYEFYNLVCILSGCPTFRDRLVFSTESLDLIELLDHYRQTHRCLPLEIVKAAFMINGKDSLDVFKHLTLDLTQLYKIRLPFSNLFLELSPKLTSLESLSIKGFTDEHLLIISNFEKLNSLELDSNFYGKDDASFVQINKSLARILLKGLKNLVLRGSKFEFIGDIFNDSSMMCPKLERFVVDDPAEISFSSVMNILGNFPALEELELNVNYWLVQEAPASLKSLRSLILGGQSQHFSVFCVKNLLEKCPKLERLTIKYLINSDNLVEIIWFLIDHNPEIKELDLRFSDTSELDLKILQNFKQLECLKLSIGYRYFTGLDYDVEGEKLSYTTQCDLCKFLKKSSIKLSRIELDCSPHPILNRTLRLVSQVPNYCFTDDDGYEIDVEESIKKASLRTDLKDYGGGGESKESIMGKNLELTVKQKYLQDTAFLELEQLRLIEKGFIQLEESRKKTASGGESKEETVDLTELMFRNGGHGEYIANSVIAFLDLKSIHELLIVFCKDFESSGLKIFDHPLIDNGEMFRQFFRVWMSSPIFRKAFSFSRKSLELGKLYSGLSSTDMELVTSNIPCFLDTFPSVRNLDLNTFQYESVLDCAQILSKYPDLECLDCSVSEATVELLKAISNLSNLKSLKLNVSRECFGEFRDILLKCWNLVSLSFGGVIDLSLFEELVSYLESLRFENKLLKELNIRNICFLRPGMSSSVLNRFIGLFPNVQSLEFRNPVIIDHFDFSSFRNLRTLKLWELREESKDISSSSVRTLKLWGLREESKDISSSGVRAISKSCPNLVDLTLSNSCWRMCPDTKDTLRIFLENCHKIKRLNLTTNHVTLDTLRLVSKFPHIESLGISFSYPCDFTSITKPEMIRFLQGDIGGIKHIDFFVGKNPIVCDERGLDGDTRKFSELRVRIIDTRTGRKTHRYFCVILDGKYSGYKVSVDGRDVKHPNMYVCSEGVPDHEKNVLDDGTRRPHLTGDGQMYAFPERSEAILYPCYVQKKEKRDGIFKVNLCFEKDFDHRLNEEMIQLLEKRSLTFSFL